MLFPYLEYLVEARVVAIQLSSELVPNELYAGYFKRNYHRLKHVLTLASNDRPWDWVFFEVASAPQKVSFPDHVCLMSVTFYNTYLMSTFIIEVT